MDNRDPAGLFAQYGDRRLSHLVRIRTRNIRMHNCTAATKGSGTARDVQVY
jgi:hypothetical protein